MFGLDNSLLEKAGLSAMPADQKPEFLKDVETELNQRIGEKISANLNDAQWDEFVKLSDGDQTIVKAILRDDPDWRDPIIIKKLAESLNLTPDNPAFAAQFASMKWIERNCPDYDQIVSSELAKMTDELRANAPKILGTAEPAS